MASSPAAGSIANRVKIPVVPSASVLPKPRGSFNTVSTSGRMIESVPLAKPSSVTKHSDISRWKENALDLHNQVLQEIERLIKAVEDEATAKKACDTAWISHENSRKMTPETFLDKAQQIVTLLKRIELPGSAVLQLTPM